MSGPTTSVTGLTENTVYTFSAWSDGNCTTGNRLATAPALATLPPQPPKPSRSSGVGTPVVISAVLGGGAAPIVRWEYKRKAGSGNYDATWRPIASTSKALIHEITDLTAGVAWRFKVRAVNASGAGAESEESRPVTPQAVTLTASAVEATTAALTPGNYIGTWYYKRITPGGSSYCVQVSNRAVLEYLDTGTSYTYKAFSDRDCPAASELASETFLTRPGQVAGVTATAGAASLNVDWTARTDTVTGYKVQWKSGPQDWSTTRETTATTNATALTGLTNGATYTIRVAATNATGAGAWSAGATGTPSASATTLTASAIQATTATLTIVNHSGRWYHKRTVPSGGECSTAVTGTTAYLTALTAGTNYTFKAYSDSNCTAGNELASVPFLTRPERVTGLTAAARPRSLAVGWTAVTGADSYKVQWKSGTQDLGSHREATVSGTTHTIPSLTNATAYVIRVAATNATGTGAWSTHATATPAPVSLTASAVRPTTATLTLTSHGGPWYHKHTVPGGGRCSAAVAGATADLTGLDAGTRYTFTAYGDRDCATELAAAAPFLTPLAQVTGVTVATGQRSLAVSWTAVTRADSYTVQWRSGTQGYEHGGAREATVESGTAYTIPSLTNGTAYTVRVRAVDTAGGAGEWSAEAAGTPAAVTLTASDVEATTATLTIANHTGAWSYKRPGQGSCGSVETGAFTASLAHLVPGTSYTYKAYRTVGCSGLAPTELTTDETDAHFLTKPGQVTGVTAASGNASLVVSWTALSGTLTGYKVQWKSGSDEYDTDARQKEVTSGTSTTITGLTDGAGYTVRVIGYNATGDGAASVEASATPAATLTASAVEAGTATLTISSHPGSWYYRYTVPSGDTSCTEASGATERLDGLTAGTSYTFKAYGDRGCATEATSDATDAELLTKPGQVTGVTVTPGNTSLAVSWTAASGTVTGYRVQWKSSNESWDTTRQSTVTGGATGDTITDLTNGAAYTVRVTAYNATGDGAASAETSAAAAATLTASAVEADTATLTIDHTGGWYWKRTAPATPPDTCSTVVGGGTKTASLAGLDAGTSYTFKAYGDAICTEELTSDATDADFLTRPGQVTGVTVTSADASLAVSWTAPGGTVTATRCSGGRATRASTPRGRSPSPAPPAAPSRVWRVWKAAPPTPSGSPRTTPPATAPPRRRRAARPPRPPPRSPPT